MTVKLLWFYVAGKSRFLNLGRLGMQAGRGMRQWFEADDRRGKFAREVGSVVLGVLIALGIGEVADAVRWQVRVDTSLSAIRQEMAGNRFNLVERSIYQPCLQRRLVAIGSILAAARRTHSLPFVGSIDGPHRRAIETAAFEVAKSEGVPLHMARGDARDLALAYGLGAEVYGAETAAEIDSWTTLQLMENAEGPIDSDLLATLLQAWVHAQSSARTIAGLASEADKFMAKSGAVVEYQSYRSKVELARISRAKPLCHRLMVGAAARTRRG